MKVIRTRLSLALTMAICLAAGSSPASQALPKAASGLPAPSSLPLRDYETILYKWLFDRQYGPGQGKLNWAVDKRVRDTGPFIDGESYGVHPAVRIYYSPEVMAWLKGGRKGDVKDGGVIVKEMFNSPADIYNELYRGLQQKYPDDSDKLEAAFNELLEPLLTGWTVMVRDSKGSKDGWFWAGPGTAGTYEKMLENNLDNYQHYLYSTFGEYTCLRCHASAESEFTFSTTNNIRGFPGSPLQFRNDNTWRSKNYLTTLRNWDAIKAARDTAGVTAQFPVPDEQIPWLEQVRPSISLHTTNPVDSRNVPDTPLKKPNPAFTSAFPFPPVNAVRAFPSEYADHVFPGPGGPGPANTSPYEYVTSDNCIGCHGGLGGAPSDVTMFLQTGPKYGQGYNVSEYGEWRWSPMGLAGRDPIFHSQLECEMIMLVQDSRKNPMPLKASLADTQQAVIDTCLRCHGAMGERQLSIDAGEDRKLPSGHPVVGKFNPEYFYLEKLLSSSDPIPQPPAQGKPILQPNPEYHGDDFYDYHKYGALAREGISCTTCHRIAPPSEQEVSDWVVDIWQDPATKDWLGSDQVDGVNALSYLLMKNTTGTYKRNERGDELYGPFDDVATLPMENSLGIKPLAAPPAVGAWPDPHTGKVPTFTQDSQMCGTCHAINLPNIGATPVKSNVLNFAETVDAFHAYDHSIEQATFLEWQNSDFGPGVDNQPKDTFQSCQDCHMPGGFQSLDGKIDIKQLVTQIATIQDTTYPAVEHMADPDELDIPSRSDYRRHQLVGLNVFLIEMINQFPSTFGVDLTDNVMTYAETGSSLAVDSMLLQAQNSTVTVDFVGQPSVSNGTLTSELKITNLTGHRFPSGVSFRRAFVEFVVQDGDDVVWSSGQTNAAGLILGGDGQPLKTEFLDTVTPDNSFADYQPHYQVITSPDQVQIYEELILNGEVPPPGTPAGQLPQFTTSFIHRITHVKDNRLLPRGWVPSEEFASQGQVMQQFMAATDPEGPSVVGGQPLIGPHPEQNGAFDAATGKYAADPNYVKAGPLVGSDNLIYQVQLPAGVDPSKLTVKATMYSQSLMPAWLHQRFEQAAWAKKQGYPTPETDRLYHVTSQLNLKGTAVENWKLPLVSASATVKAK